MKYNFKATVWKESDWFIAQCLDIDIASQGETETEALENLKEALKLHFAQPVATDAPEVRSLEVELNAA